MDPSLSPRFPEDTVSRQESFGELAYSHSSRHLYLLNSDKSDLSLHVLNAPVCLSWEITSACNLHCNHCLSSSGKQSQNELSTVEAMRLIDEWVRMKVFYINIGGGEPLLRPDFYELMEYALEGGLGIKVSTNGKLVDDTVADWIATRKNFDVQISIDGGTEQTNDQLRGKGSYHSAWQAVHKLVTRGFTPKINMVVTTQNFAEIEQLYAMSSRLNCELRLTRLRPAGRGADIWREMRPTPAQNKALYFWLIDHPDVLTGDSFFHLSAYGQPLSGMDFCGAARFVCCVDPIGEVFGCPFMISSELSSGNVRQSGGFENIWRESFVFSQLRQLKVGGECLVCPAFSVCHGGCPAVKKSLGLPLDSPDPDCVFLT